MSWLYILNGKEYPASNVELRFDIASGSVKPDDLVKGPGMATWMKASEATGLLGGPADVLPATARSLTPEGDFTVLVGNTIVWLSLLSAAICTIMFGQVDVPSDVYADSMESRWVPMLVTIFIASGLNGAFFGFLLSKVGSILRKLEAAKVA